MGTRQKIKKEEERIRRLIREDSDEKPAATRAWNRMLDYFATNDYLEGNNHVKIITYIYLTRYYMEDTEYYCACKNNIGERTLYRYRKKYISCFQWYFKEEQRNERQRKKEAMNEAH